MFAGEVTLTGRVLPIGGVKEKTIAARRSGVKTLIFPKANQHDFEELSGQLHASLHGNMYLCFVGHCLLGIKSHDVSMPSPNSLMIFTRQFAWMLALVRYLSQSFQC